MNQQLQQLHNRIKLHLQKLQAWFNDLNQGEKIAVSVPTLLLVWMLTGLFSHEKPPLDQHSSDNKRPHTVQVQTLHAQEISQEIILHGRTAPGRSVTIRAEVDGKVTATHIQKGSTVKSDDVILEIDVRDLDDRLAQAKALVVQRDLEYKGSLKLKGQGLLSEIRLAEAKALLEDAKANATKMQFSVDATKVTAPFSGTLNTRAVELGDFIQEGDAIATIHDYNPYIIEGELSEREAPNIKIGSRGYATLITGEHVEGIVRYISSAANPATHGFQLELEVPHNINFTVLSGITAKIRIPFRSVKAQFISPASLSLQSDGKLGVKVMTKDKHVNFIPIKIVKTESNGIWVEGLNDNINIITTGHAFVETGEAVEPSYVNSDQSNL